jgi:predicted nucleic acid-binding protein
MSADTWYIDTSALVKTVIVEAESAALHRWLEPRRSLASCDLIHVEAVRAVRMADPDAVHHVRRAIATLTLLRLDEDLLAIAADLEPPLRSLDAIHLAAALQLGPDLAGVLTYDQRMADSAEALGLKVLAPAEAPDTKNENTDEKQA